MKICEIIDQKKIIVIVRGTYGNDLIRLSHALHKGGIRLMEVTFDQKDPNHIERTAEAISALNREYGGEMRFGAGTVLTQQEAKAAHSAGGEFIISPNFSEAVIKCTKELGMVSIPGAMTPTEIVNAHGCGADYVKLFPAATLGLKYVKDILAPIGHIRMIATAGITEQNFAEFLKLGLAGAGISGRLTDKKLIAEGNWDEFTRRAKGFVDIAAGA